MQTIESLNPSSQTSSNQSSLRVLLLGATGTIGQACAIALQKKGFEVVAFLRPPKDVLEVTAADITLRYPYLEGVTVRFGDVTSPNSLLTNGFCHESFDVIVSCLASRTGLPKDAWAIDYQAHVNILEIAKQLQIKQIVLLSAICVQKPLLAFQKAKLAFEQLLIDSGITYSIVRPTAFFKSLSGQFKRVQNGKSFLLFADGQLTACKPIRDDDLGMYLANCIDTPALHNQILPIGGPGPAITPLQQGKKLFELLGKTPKYTNVPVGLMDSIIFLLSMLGYVIPKLKDKAELARIGRYYATESMLVFDHDRGQYDEKATPSFGTHTLFEYYEQLSLGKTQVKLGDHAVF